jgi:hypothetical protein
MEIESLGAPTSQCRHARRRRRRNTLLAIGCALVVGAGVGAAVHYASTAAPSSTTVVQTLTVSAPPGQLTPTIASQRDPVCEEWDTATRTYRAQQASSTARCGRASARPTRYTGHCRSSGRPTASAVR